MSSYQQYSNVHNRGKFGSRMAVPTISILGTGPPLGTHGGNEFHTPQTLNQRDFGIGDSFSSDSHTQDVPTGDNPFDDKYTTDSDRAVNEGTPNTSIGSSQQDDSPPYLQVPLEDSRLPPGYTAYKLAVVEPNSNSNSGSDRLGRVYHGHHSPPNASTIANTRKSLIARITGATGRRSADINDYASRDKGDETPYTDSAEVIEPPSPYWSPALPTYENDNHLDGRYGYIHPTKAQLASRKLSGERAPYERQTSHSHSATSSSHNDAQILASLKERLSHLNATTLNSELPRAGSPGHNDDPVLFNQPYDGQDSASMATQGREEMHNNSSAASSAAYTGRGMTDHSNDSRIQSLRHQVGEEQARFQAMKSDFDDLTTKYNTLKKLHRVSQQTISHYRKSSQLKDDDFDKSQSRTREIAKQLETMYTIQDKLLGASQEDQEHIDRLEQRIQYLNSQNNNMHSSCMQSDLHGKIVSAKLDQSYSGTKSLQDNYVSLAEEWAQVKTSLDKSQQTINSLNHYNAELKATADSSSKYGRRFMRPDQTRKDGQHGGEGVQ
ncbi:uncharacterized protein IL334_007684 [Kwoniella shivajii]|uniref:Uncharacterized protein n=1 Tax=Kwoniella shivajii TaxID=564305 RepID=A0ABZ1DCH1_9TREE|nr:hypothetical protein IL334_007684 [Kwoniella shivajii]